MDKINVYINSKNRAYNESSSDFTVRIPQNLLRLNLGEYFMLNVDGFYCFNSWFNCIDGFNNQFQIIIKNINDEIFNITNYKLDDGNPNVNDVKSNINSLLYNHVLITYDKLKNKFVFKRVLPVDNSNYKMYLNIINSEDFLGFRKSERNKYIELPYLEYVYSSYVVNIVGDEAIIIKLSGDCVLAGNTIDNFGTSTYEPSKIIFIKSIDVPPNGLLKYNNEDSGDSFNYRIANVEQITWFKLTVHNQDNELIPDFSDYILTLQFTKHKLNEDTTNILSQILDFVKQIYLLISHVIFPAIQQN